MFKINQFNRNKQQADVKGVSAKLSYPEYKSTPNKNAEILKIDHDNRKVAFYNDIRNRRDFDEKLKKLFSAEFAERISSILLTKETEFISSIVKSVKTQLEMLYNSDIFDEKVMKEAFERCERQFKKEYQANNKFLSTAWNDYEINSQAIKKYSSSKDKAVKISTKNQENFSFLKSFRKHCTSTDSLAYHDCISGAKMLEVYDETKEVDGEKGKATHVICTECKCCFFADSIKLNCNRCSVEYYSQVLEVGENPDIQPATWSKYHCGMLMNDKMRCIKCRQVLYLNLKTDKLVCLNRSCKFEAKSMSIIWVCVMCKKEFNSEAKVYNPLDFKPIKNAIELAISLRQRARPSNVPCCDLDIYENIFFHKKECHGELYQGVLDKKPIVVCGQCKSMNFYDKYLWTCPICKKRFQDRKDIGNNLDCSFLISGAVGLNESRRESNKSYLEKDYHSVQEKHVTPKLSIENPKAEQISNSKQCDTAKIVSNENNSSYDSVSTNKNEVKSNQASKKHKSLMDILLERKSSIKKENLQNNLLNLVKDDVKIDLSKEYNELQSMDNKQNEDSNPINNKDNKSKNKLSCSNSQAESSEALKGPYVRGARPPLPKIIESSKSYEKNSVLKLEDFRVIKQIGQGSYGKIYLIEDKSKREFAMKKIIAHCPDELAAIRKEFELLNSIEHENIMKIYGIMEKTLDTTTYALYIIMERAIRDWDEEIKDRLEKKLPYTEEELFNIIRQLVDALAFLQKKKISHRDIKPPNILVFENNVYKLGDFGEAKEMKLWKELNTLRGTDIFMSPILFESLKENKDDVTYVTHNVYKSDVFSLGYCLLYAATLCFESITEVRDLKNMKSTIVVLNKYLNSKYSSKMIGLLAKMIDVYERTRYDFVDMVNYLKEKIFSG